MVNKNIIEKAEIEEIFIKGERNPTNYTTNKPTDYNNKERKEFNIIIIGFPIYALDSPVIVKDFLENLKSKINEISAINNKHYGFAFFTTMGFAAGNSIRKSFRILQSPWTHYLGGVNIKMPGSDAMSTMDINSKYVKKALQRDFRIIPELDEFLEKITNKIKNLNDKNDFYKIEEKLPRSLLDIMFGWSLHILYKPFLKHYSKKFFVDENCSLCKYCIEICPMENISLIEKKITFSDKCIFCLRCLNQCPKQAIQIGKMTIGKFRWKGPLGDFHAPILRKQ